MAKRILVIDDDENIRRLYRAELAQAGFEVESAANGADAIGQVRPGKYDLAIVDIEMPGLSGLELLKELRQLAPEIRLILNTAYSVYKADFNSWLADAYVVKSSDMNELIETIKKLVAPSESKQRQA